MDAVQTDYKDANAELKKQINSARRASQHVMSTGHNLASEIERK